MVDRCADDDHVVAKSVGVEMYVNLKFAYTFLYEVGAILSEDVVMKLLAGDTWVVGLEDDLNVYVTEEVFTGDFRCICHRKYTGRIKAMDRNGHRRSVWLVSQVIFSLDQ